jgi:sugar lactone lactonase YvrE
MPQPHRRRRWELVVLFAFVLDLRAATITTVAGGQSGDGRPGTSVVLGVPDGVALDSARNVYIADTEDHRIRRLDAATGIVTTVAGNGGAGFSGDGGPATAAALNGPIAVAVDSSGNLYIADEGNRRIRKVNAATGIITTVAGKGNGGIHLDGIPATEAAIGTVDLALDAAGNLYLADQESLRVRKIDAATQIITTVAGNGGDVGFAGDGGPAQAATLGLIEGVSVDPAGNIYIADNDPFGNTGRIRKVDAVTQIITTVAGGGTATSSDFGPPTNALLRIIRKVVADSSGNFYLSDNSRIRKVIPSSNIIVTVAGGGGATGEGVSALTASIGGPAGFAVDSSAQIYFVETLRRRVRKVDGGGTVNTIAGSQAVGDGGAATEATLSTPSAVAVDSAGNLYIADSRNSRIRRVDGTTGVVTTVAGTGITSFGGDGGPAAAAALNFPTGVAVDRSGNVFIADTFNRRIRRVDAASQIITTYAGTGSGTFSGDGGPATAAGLSFPNAVAVDASGNLYISDRDGFRIRKVDPATRTITTVAGTSFGFDGDGGPATAAKIWGPSGVAVDEAGNIYIADTTNNRVRKIAAATQIITTVAGSGANSSEFYGDGGPATAAALPSPKGVAVDADGNLYIVDNAAERVLKVSAATGILTTLVGGGPEGILGDGGPPKSAALSSPEGLAVSGDTVYIADTDNHRVRAAPSSSAPLRRRIVNRQ